MAHGAGVDGHRRHHLRWSRDGTWEAIDARSVWGAATVTGPTRGYDAGKKISGRKTFGVVDTLGLLVAVLVVAAGTSDNVGGTGVLDRARPRSKRFAKLWCDAGFKAAFARYCRERHIAV